MSIRSKLILMMLVTSIASIVVVGFQGYRSGRKALESRIYSQLTSLRHSKTNQVETYFAQVEDEVIVTCNDPTVAEAMQQFRESYRQLTVDGLYLDEGQKGKLKKYYQNEYIEYLEEGGMLGADYEDLKPQSFEAEYLQYHYLAENPDVDVREELMRANDESYYSDVHARYHRFFKDIADRYRFYDLFLIDRETLSVVYSIFKSPEFGTSLASGPYAESGLKKVAQEVSDNPAYREGVRMADFVVHKPSLGKPASFMAGPIYADNQCIGILAVQIPIEEINRIMTGSSRSSGGQAQKGQWVQEGLGQTGEVFMVGPDYTMRNDSRFFLEDRDGFLDQLAGKFSKTSLDNIRSQDTTVLFQEVHTAPVKEALRQGFEGSGGSDGVASTDAEEAEVARQNSMVASNYRSKRVLSSYGTVRPSPKIRWAILAEMEMDEAFAQTRGFLRRLTISAVVQTLLITFLALILTHIFLRPISHLISAVRRLAKGDSDVTVNLNTNDELGELSGAFNEMVGAIGEKNQLIDAKTRENEALLLNLVPSAVASRIQQGEKNIADSFPHVTVMFAGLVGFDDKARTSAPEEVIRLLNELISSFDSIVEQYGVEKVRTTGASYVAACGLSVARLDHAKRCYDAACEMLRTANAFSHEHRIQVKLRVGLDSGSVVAGVVGTRKFVYDLWGDPVNMANQIRYDALPGSVQISERVYDRLEQREKLEECSVLETKTLGDVKTWRYIPGVDEDGIDDPEPDTVVDVVGEKLVDKIREVDS